MVQSVAAQQIARQPRLLGIVEEAIGLVDLAGDKPVVEHDMHRMIGYDYIVPTTEKDTVFYARLAGDGHYTRFIKNSDPKQTRYITLHLLRQEDDTYTVSYVQLGRKRPDQPELTDGESAAKKSRAFWEKHAVVSESRHIQASSVTKDCPY